MGGSGRLTREFLDLPLIIYLLEKLSRGLIHNVRRFEDDQRRTEQSVARAGLFRGVKDKLLTMGFWAISIDPAAI